MHCHEIEAPKRLCGILHFSCQFFAFEIRRVNELEHGIAEEMRVFAVADSPHFPSPDGTGASGQWAMVIARAGALRAA